MFGLAFGPRKRGYEAPSKEVYLTDYQTVDGAKTNIGQFIADLYDTKQLHSSQGYLPPAEFEPTYSLYEVAWPLVR
jgi:hypothetical protein